MLPVLFVSMESYILVASAEDTPLAVNAETNLSLVTLPELLGSRSLIIFEAILEAILDGSNPCMLPLPAALIDIDILISLGWLAALKL
ncbi:hypothetical protein GALL_534120 [mine drainage metagenome]|uniref:Uncharacterized protein n=1 Tax=mine drainage metagenome TaxID=410659 RepID=A0A1J5P1U5_9ZZZZ